MADAAEKQSMNLCNICGREFQRMADLRRHERGHEGKGPYHCCGRAFRDKDVYTQHRCSKHGASRNFSCAYSGCKSSFSTNHTLQRHVNEVHNQGARRFSCEECDQEFWYRHQLSEHISVEHKGEKKHRCAECGKSYVHRSGLSRHRTLCSNKQGN